MEVVKVVKLCKNHLSTAEPKIGFCSVAIAEHLRQELDIGGLSTAAASTTWVFFCCGGF